MHSHQRALSGERTTSASTSAHQPETLTPKRPAARQRLRLSSSNRAVPLAIIQPSLSRWPRKNSSKYGCPQRCARIF